MMNNARHILMQIYVVIGSTKKTERDVDDFCSWIEVQVMTELFESLPEDKQEQAIHQFMTLPPHKKESVFYPLLYRRVHAGESEDGDEKSHRRENC
jgi:hypothetical protein